MSNSFRLKNYSIRANRSLAPLDTSNPNFNKSASPVRSNHVKTRAVSAKPSVAKKTLVTKKPSGSRSVGTIF